MDLRAEPTTPPPPRGGNEAQTTSTLASPRSLIQIFRASLAFYVILSPPPGFQMSTGRDGVKLFHHYNLENNKYFPSKKWGSQRSFLSYKGLKQAILLLWHQQIDTNTFTDDWAFVQYHYCSITWKY